MAPPPTYRPILLTKRGERSALTDTPATVKATLLPVLVVEPIDWNYDTDAPAKTIDEHLARKAEDLSASWGFGEAAVDLVFHDDTPMTSGDHPLFWLIGAANGLGMRLIPAVAPDRSPAYVAAAAAAVARDGAGACIRLPLAQWPSTVGPTHLDTLVTSLGIGPDAIDLILDLGEEVAAAPGLALAATVAQISALPHLASWRTVTVAGAGFPKALTGLSRGAHRLDRFEWNLYQALITTSPTRIPLFGDYVIAHPDPSVDVNPAFMSISASLRYTIANHWLVLKGELYKGQGGSGQGGAAVQPIAAALIAEADYLGIDHCQMETWLAEVAGGGSGGRPEEWRRYGTRHHLQVVSDQLASPPGTSAGP